MTIPSRPAPPPPSQQQGHYQQQQQNISGNKLNALSKYNKTKLSIKINESITSKASSISSENKNYSNWNEIDPFDTVNKLTESQNMKKKNPPPPRPPPPKIDDKSSSNKKMGGSLQMNKLSNLFKNKKNAKYNQQVQLNLMQKYSEGTLSGLLPPSSFNYSSDSQSRPYAFVSPFIQNNKNEAELISFDSPPNSPKLVKKSSFSATLTAPKKNTTSIIDLNFNNTKNNYEILQQNKSGFEDDFSLSSVDPWESLAKNNVSTPQYLDFSKISQPVRNINTVNDLKGDDTLSNGKSILPPVPTLNMPTIIKPKTPNGSSYIGKSFSSNFISDGCNNSASISASTNKMNSAPKAPLAFAKNENQQGDLGNDFEFDYSLPMPNCPPPPPPQVNVDNANIDPSEPSYGIALYDFDGLEEGDLPLRENEKVYILNKLNDNWFFGRNKRGCEGIFPSNYVDIKIPLKDEDEITSRHSGASSSMSDKIYRAKCLYNFVGEVPEDLSLNENDIVTVLYQINEDWLYGEIGDKKGQFPANYVEIV